MAGGDADAKGGKMYLFDEVIKHNQETDCWLIIEGKVYDVTKFMDDHPGGGDVLVNSAGRDSTNDFEDIGHSSDARKMLADYYIGEVDPTTMPEPAVKAATKARDYSAKSESGTGVFMLILQILVPIAIIALAIAVRFLTAPKEASS